MANLGQECGYFVAEACGIRYDGESLSSPLSRIFVRLGLILVRCLIWAKAMVIRGARLLAAIFRPIGKLVLSVFFVPVYRAGFASRRQIVHWYRPAKNRLMFFVTNRAVMHIAITGVVLGTMAINLGMDTVRAETLDAFNKSLAYAVITQEQSPFVEEFADMDPAALRGDAMSYLSYGSLGAPLGATDGQQSELSSATSLIGGGSLAVPIMADASASVAPRESVESYIVADGDTISTIAARFGISVNTVLWANNLTLRSVLKLGQTLTILPTSGLMHTVKKGDTLSKIAKMYSADSAAILAANTLADEGAISAGQKLVVPGGTPVAIVPARPSTASVHSVFVASPSTSAGTKAVSSSARMLWPSDGHYIVRGLSWFHTGVDIDCDGHRNGTSTQDNYAAAAGTVTFSGWSSGYGYFVIIDHGNGLKTRYGHNYSLYVKSGQSVAAGTPIGRCGSTGNSTGTHLHFEVVGANGSRDFRNPLEYIR